MKRLLIGCYVLMDSLAVFLALMLAAWLKFDAGMFPETHVSVAPHVVLLGALASILYWIPIFAVSGLYQLHWDLSWTDELSGVFKPVTMGVTGVLVLAFLLNTTLTMGRWILVIYYVLLLVLVFASRSTGRLLERRFARSGMLRRKALIFGVGSHAVELAGYLSRNEVLGYEIVGFVRPPHSGGELVDPARVAGSHRDLEGLLQSLQIDELLVTIASNFHEDILALLLPATALGVRVKVLPDLFDVVAGHVHSTQITGHPLMVLSPVRLRLWQRIIKTTADYVLSLVFLLLGLPLLLLVALAIRLDSRGPVFYRQERVGKGGRVFRVFKFRSMVRDAERKSGPVWAGRDDPRVTRIGRILRKTRIDEMPQFLNVIRGEMSIVGPRPERPSFVAELASVYPFYPKRLTVKPGITGWAQVKRGYDTSMEDVAEKLKLDFYYMENQSLFLDLEILLRTIRVILTGSGAH
ncbi:sugar transferase [Candidatus Fermentibacterales bacterium]|nr:sugar transferase [Candidatus Fermentibacterales bacterium]